MKEVWLLDSGAGNVRSLRNAVSSLGWVVRDVTSAADIDAANILLFPGVGAFGSAMAVLRSRGLVEPLVRHVPFVLAGWQWLLGSKLGGTAWQCLLRLADARTFPCRAGRVKLRALPVEVWTTLPTSFNMFLSICLSATCSSAGLVCSTPPAACITTSSPTSLTNAFP